MSIIKLLGPEISVTTDNPISSSRLVRVYAAALSVLTIKDSEDNVLGTITLPAGSIQIIQKSPTDVISGTTTLLCTPIAYRS